MRQNLLMDSGTSRGATLGPLFPDGALKSDGVFNGTPRWFSTEHLEKKGLTLGEPFQLAEFPTIEMHGCFLHGHTVPCIRCDIKWVDVASCFRPQNIP